LKKSIGLPDPLVRRERLADVQDRPAQLLELLAASRGPASPPSSKLVPSPRRLPLLDAS
jgi:hypothetical protein